MRDKSGEAPNFIDHLDTISCDLLLKAPKYRHTIIVVTMKLEFRNVKTTEVVPR